MKKIILWVLLLLALPFALKAETWTLRSDPGIRTDSIVTFLLLDTTVTNRQVAANADSVIRGYTVQAGYWNIAVALTYFHGFEGAISSFAIRDERTQRLSTEQVRLPIWWPLRATSNLLTYRNDTLVDSQYRTNALTFDQVKTFASGNFYKVVHRINYPGVHTVSSTYNFNLKDTGTNTGGTIPGIGPHVCQVSLLVRLGNGQPAANQYVSCYMANSGVKDSTGASIANVTFYDKTDASGIVKFNCIWSSYLIPNTKWVFKGQSPAISQLRQVITVPRQTTYLISL